LDSFSSVVHLVCPCMLVTVHRQFSCQWQCSRSPSLTRVWSYPGDIGQVSSYNRSSTIPFVVCTFCRMFPYQMPDQLIELE